MTARVFTVAASAGDTGARFREALDDAVRRAQEQGVGVIVDLRSAATLGYLSAIALLRASYLVAAAGRRMVVVAPDRATLRALQRVGIGTSLKVSDTLQEARRLVGGQA